MASPV